jgi:hypothetical protein
VAVAGAVGAAHHARKEMKSVAKSYKRGTITAHKEQAGIHSRKARNGRKLAEVGSAAFGTGALLSAAAEPTKVTTHLARGGLYGGGAAVVGGAGYAAYHTHQRNKRLKASQAARLQRNAEMGKSFRSTAGVVRNARQTAENVQRTTAHGEEIAGKVKRLIPSPRAAQIGAGVGIGGLAAGNGVATYVGARQGTKAGMKRSVSKANREDAKQAAGAGALGTGSVASGLHARRLRRVAGGHAVRAGELRTSADASANEATQRLLRAKKLPGQPANLQHGPKNPVNIDRTIKTVTSSRMQHMAADSELRAAGKIARKAKTPTAAAVALGAGAIGVAAHKRRDAYAPASYR